MKNTIVKICGQEIDLSKDIWVVELRILEIFKENKIDMQKFIDSLHMFVIIDEEERKKREIVYKIIKDLIHRV